MIDIDIFPPELELDVGAIVAYNTGTLLDLHLGEYCIGIDGRWYFNGGFGNFIIVVEAEPNCHKSTLSDSLMMCCIANYPKTRFFNLENEGNKRGERLRMFINSLLQGGLREEVQDRVILWSKRDATSEEIDAKVKEIVGHKEASAKKLMISTPFSLNDIPVSVMFPTFLNIDSWTNMGVDTTHVVIDKVELSDSANNIDALTEGRIKTRFVSKLSRQITRGGLCVVTTCQLGEKKAALGAPAHLPVQGDTPHAKQGKTSKRAGTELIKRSMATIQILSAKPLCARKEMVVGANADLEAEYPLDGTPPGDLQELTISTSRNKLASSGTQVPVIVSQSVGLLPDVTNFHFIKNVKGYNGFDKDGGGGRWSLELYPSVIFTRNTIRELALKDYKLARALDLTARYVYMRATHGNNYRGLDWSRPLADMVAIAKKKGFDMNILLESTEIWMPGFLKDKEGNTLGAHGRRHMTLLEFIELCMDA